MQYYLLSKLQEESRNARAPEYLSDSLQGLETLYLKAKQALEKQIEYSIYTKKRVNYLRGLINSEADNLVKALNQRINESNTTVRSQQGKLSR